MGNKIIQNYLDNLISPDIHLLVSLIALLFLDLISGIQKSNKNNIVTISSGLRRSLDKINLYFSLSLSYFVVINITVYSNKFDSIKVALPYTLDGLFLFYCYIEFKSILENIIEAYPESDIVKWIAIPLHNILILKFTKK